MSCIRSTVGPGKLNAKDDVLIIQRLLNSRIGELIPYAPLEENGIFNDAMESMIREFQSRVQKMTNPDACVDPQGHTIIALMGGSQAHTAQGAKHRANPAHVNAFIDMALPAAKKVKEKWNVPIAVILAQSAVESGWGQHVKDNAYFGIKGKAPDGNSTTFATTEVIDGKVIHINDSFRAYKDYEESADDYGRFLNGNKNYAEAFKTTDPLKFVDAVAAGGYATDPNYAKTLKSVIRSFGLDAYDK